MDAFATFDDLRKRWPEAAGLSDEMCELAVTRLCDVSAQIASLLRRSRVRLLFEGEDGYEEQRQNLVRVTCGAVMRSMQAMVGGGPLPTAPVAMETITAGVFSQTYQYSNPSGDAYLTKAERESLGIGRMRVSSIRAAMTDREALDA